MIKTSVLILLLAAFLYSQTLQLSLFEENGKFGYKDQTNQIVIKPRFIVAMDFSEAGIAAVVDSTGWAYIDTLGQIVIRPFVYDNGPDYFSESLARFVEKNKFGFFDESGSVVIEPQWDFAYPFKNGKAAVCNGCRISIENEHGQISDGRWGYIDKTGKVIVPIGSVEADSAIQCPDSFEIFKH